MFKEPLRSTFGPLSYFAQNCPKSALNFLDRPRSSEASKRDSRTACKLQVLRERTSDFNSNVRKRRTTEAWGGFAVPAALLAAAPSALAPLPVLCARLLGLGCHWAPTCAMSHGMENGLQFRFAHFWNPIGVFFVVRFQSFSFEPHNVKTLANACWTCRMVSMTRALIMTRSAHLPHLPIATG